VAEERFEDAQANKETPAVPRKYQYVWDIRYIHAAVLRDEDTDADNDCTDAATGIQGANEGDEHLYYCQDANFNVTAILDGYDGAAVERYMYDPYGKPTILNGVRDSTGAATTEWNTRLSNTFQNAILYCGYFFDDESGLYHVRNRYYLPYFGWITRDPIVYGDGLNLLQYVGSAPIGRVDASGTRGILDYFSAFQNPVSDWLGEQLYEWGKGTPEMAAAFFAIGGGPNTYQFKPGDAFLETVRNDPFMDEVRGRVRETLQGRCEYPACDATSYTKENEPHEYKSKGIIGDLELGRDYAYAGLQFAPVPSMGLQALGATKASAYLGTYNVEWEAENIKCCRGKAKIAFHVWDFWNAETLSNVPFIGPRLPNSPFGERGPIGGTTWLYFDWEEEDFEFKGDRKCFDK
jgi:RHS repeat-associated protein